MLIDFHHGIVQGQSQFACSCLFMPVPLFLLLLIHVNMDHNVVEKLYGVVISFWAQIMIFEPDFPSVWTRIYRAIWQLCSSCIIHVKSSTSNNVDSYPLCRKFQYPKFEPKRTIHLFHTVKMVLNQPMHLLLNQI